MEDLKMIYICKFISYSGDDFYLKTKDKDDTIKNAETFCKTYIPDEYESWEREKVKFKYHSYKIYEIKEGKTLKIPLSFGEYEIVNPDDIKEFNVAYFSDQYRPKLIIPE